MSGLNKFDILSATCASLVYSEWCLWSGELWEMSLVINSLFDVAYMQWQLHFNWYKLLWRSRRLMLATSVLQESGFVGLVVNVCFTILFLRGFKYTRFCDNTRSQCWCGLLHKSSQSNANISFVIIGPASFAKPYCFASFESSLCLQNVVSLSHSNHASPEASDPRTSLKSFYGCRVPCPSSTSCR